MKNVVGISVIVLALGLTSGCIVSKEGYVARGNKLMDAGKYEDAAINYRKATQKDPNYGEAYYRLGLAAVKLGKGLEAYEKLFRAVQLQPQNLDAKEKLGGVCLAIYLEDSRHPKALYDTLDKLSKELLASNSRSYEGLVVKAYLAFGDHQTKDAIDLFRRAQQINSSDPGVTTSLAKALLQDGQAQEAEKIGMGLINTKTSYAPAYDLMYAYYSTVQRAGEAESILKAKVDNNPKQADYYFQLAGFYAQQQRVPEMKTTLQRLLDNPKDFPQATQWVGDFYMARREYPEAIHYYQEGLRASAKGPQHSLYQDKTLLALLTQGKTEEGLRLADQILAENPADGRALRLRADLWMNAGKSDNVDAALKTYQDLLKQNPADPTLRVHLGRAYRMKGNLDAARKEFREALRIQSTLVEAKYEMGLTSLMLQRPAEALQQANEILTIRPDSRPARLLRSESLIRSGDLKTARVELAKLVKDHPQDRQVQFQSALMAFADKKFADAIETLNALRGTGDPQVFVGLASIYASRREFDKAFDVLNDGLRKAGESYQIHNQMALTAVMASQNDRAIAEFGKVLAMDPKSVETMRLIGDVNLLKGAQDEAVRWYRQAYDTAPNDVASALALAGALNQANHAPEARTLYMNIAKAHPDDPVVLNNAAFALAETGGDLDEALQFAKSALAKSPKDPSFSDTMGYVYLKRGAKDSAVDTFNMLVRKYPHYPLFHYHLGLTYYEKGDKTSARKQLELALADHPSKRDEDRIRELLKKLG